MSLLTIANATVVPMTGSRQSFHGYVRIKDGVILEASAGEPEKAPGETIDAAGCALMPGLINAHTHLYQVLLRAAWDGLALLPWLERIYGAARVLRPEHFYAGSLLACVEAIRSGVTTVCEHNFLNPQPECAFETIRAVCDSGLRAVFARTIMDTGEIVPDCVKETPAQAFRHTEELLRAHKQNGLLSFMTGPNTPPLNTTPELLREIRRFADDHSIGISAHVAESASLVELTKRAYGRSGVVELLDDFGIAGPQSIFAHCVHVSADEIAILKDRGASVSHNPVSNMMLGDGVAPIVEMLRRGVNIALGTDGAASNHSQDMFETMKTASLLQKVRHHRPSAIEPYTVLQMATQGGARALGLSAVCGTVAAGKRADLILVRLDTAHTQPVNELLSQLVHCAKASDVETVIVDGRVLMRNRELQLLDERKVLEEARKANADLKARLAALPS
ncbi:MAG TPA: amidohydrolase [Candidatus Acidoferrales bacterium]|nr:amidohydrolase [Candidatus Acidoferrales bacterium]